MDCLVSSNIHAHMEVCCCTIYLWINTTVWHGFGLKYSSQMSSTLYNIQILRKCSLFCQLGFLRQSESMVWAPGSGEYDHQVKIKWSQRNHSKNKAIIMPWWQHGDHVFCYDRHILTTIHGKVVVYLPCFYCFLKVQQGNFCQSIPNNILYRVVLQYLCSTKLPWLGTTFGKISKIYK